MALEKYEVIIIGGSYAGLSAAMSLGRALRNILVIDAGLPCNRQTPHSHNFLTNDGKTPTEIAKDAKQQVLKYPSVKFYEGLVTTAEKTSDGFSVKLLDKKELIAKRLILAVGVKDLMPSIKGFAACWGISAIHCPYCHGYEYAKEKTGILANGDAANHYAQLISNWTKNLSILTNGAADFSVEQLDKFKRHDIQIITKEIEAFKHTDGYINEVIFKDGDAITLKAIYHKPSFEHHTNIAQQLGCELDEFGFIKADQFQKTTIEGVYVCGDAATPMRSVSSAVATGTVAGAVLNNELIAEEF